MFRSGGAGSSPRSGEREKMRGALGVALLALGVLAVGVPAGAAGRLPGIDPSPALVVMDADTPGEFSAALEVVREAGARVRHAFPPHLAIVDLTLEAEERLAGEAGIVAVHRGVVDPQSLAHWGLATELGAQAWNDNYQGMEAERGLDPDPGLDSQRIPLAGDVVFPQPREGAPPAGLLRAPPYGGNDWDTSEYMYGTVVVGVILPESNGESAPETEDWTQEEMDQVTSEVIGGCDWWISECDWPNLSWIYEFSYQVPTGWEPINTNQSFLWKGEVIEALGFNTAYEYAAYLRDTYDTDWCMLTYVVDSSNDPDGMFPNGSFGYASLGGPTLTMTYDNDNWGIGNMDAVMAHETGHIFYALDEYIGACGCAGRSGYFNGDNGNCKINPFGGCTTNQGNCIMRSTSLLIAMVCEYTEVQIGWRDSDGDDIPDVLDTNPETMLDEYLPDPTEEYALTYTGTAHVEPLTNLNPYGQGNNVSINTIALVEYRVDGGVWQPAAAVDGAWDDGEESYTFTTAPLDTGTHVVEARAANSVGNSDVTPALDTVRVLTATDVAAENGAGASFLLDAGRPNPFNPLTVISFSVPSEGEVRLGIYDVSGELVRRLVWGATGAGGQQAVWDGRNDAGELLPSGVYFSRLEAGGLSATSKLLLAR